MMKNLSRTMTVIVSIVLLLFVTACAEQGQASASNDPYADFKPVTLRVGHTHSETEIQHEEMLNMAKKIGERTGGKVIVEIYPSNQLGTLEDIIDQMRLGTNMALYADPGRLENFAPGISAIAAPYVIEGYEDIAKLNDLPTVQRWMSTLENDFGLTVLSWNWCQGHRYVFATKGGTTPEDFKGVQLRSAPAPIWVATVEALGATAVSLEFGEMYSAIQTKTVDGCEQNLGAIYNNSIYEVISHMTETRHVYLANTVVISGQWIRSLPDEFQKIVFEECEAGGKRTTDRLKEQENRYLSEMVAAGMKVISYNDIDIDAFMQSAEGAYNKLGLTESVNALKKELDK